jgi:hypothetical protein
VIHHVLKQGKEDLRRLRSSSGFKTSATTHQTFKEFVEFENISNKTSALYNARNIFLKGHSIFKGINIVATAVSPIFFKV